MAFLRTTRRSVERLVLLALWIFAVTLFVALVITNEQGKRNVVITKDSYKFKRKCKDWNDYEFMKAERQRTGLGEQGKAVELTDPVEIALNKKLYEETGFGVVISNKISVNRSIIDTRHKDCEKKKYLADLPKTSVIVIFRDEVKSVLLRTVHGVLNRTPRELLHEIILVNDNSTNAELYEPLQQYVDRNFNGKVKIKNLSERKGLIVTRLEGARVATGEVLVFLDSHVDVGYNWLPPLLDPIARNRRLATAPVIGDSSPENFEMYGGNEFGMRSGFDWHLVWQLLDRYLPPGIDRLKPFPNPIMLGCAFAIDRVFFLDELGGYDEGFEIWNAENYELSFKLWLCADGLYEVPCSRVSHNFRRINPSRSANFDFVGKNFKRLVETWFDEYKEIVYSREPERYKRIDPGDLSKPKAVRERLGCKPFRYFLEEIAPDFVIRFPLYENKPLFAAGQIKALSHELCIDKCGQDEGKSIGMFHCNKLNANGKPTDSQYFRLDFQKNIVFGESSFCLDAYKLSRILCSNLGFGNQIWRFHPDTRLIQSDGSKSCIKANALDKSLSLASCDENDSDQKWSFTFENKTALDSWDEILGYGEEKQLNREKFLPLDIEYC